MTATLSCAAGNISLMQASHRRPDARTHHSPCRLWDTQQSIDQHAFVFCAGKDGKPAPSKYDLVANVLHEGKAGEGAYRAHIHRKSEDAWYEVDDLRVTDILSQMVALSEAYMQIYELKQVH